MSFRLFAGVAGLAMGVVLCGASAQAAELLTNGNFEAGNGVGFESDYGYGPNDPHQGPGYYLYDAGYYDVLNNPKSEHPSFEEYGDHTSGTGLMMVINGAGDTGMDVWRETALTGAGNTAYTFSFWLRSAYSDSPAQLVLQVNGIDVSGVFAPAPTTTAWVQHSFSGFSGPLGIQSIALRNNNPAGGGNDFSLDDLSLQGTSSTPEPMSWALMLMGFGGIGAALRSRRQGRLAAV